MATGIGIAISIIIGLVVIIWIRAEFKRARHKFLALFLIAVLLFVYFSATAVFKDKTVDFKSFNGITDMAKTYFSWLASAFTNAKTFTANVIKLNSTNTTAGK